jgi:hypothetical protein
MAMIFDLKARRKYPHSFVAYDHTLSDRYFLLIHDIREYVKSRTDNAFVVDSLPMYLRHFPKAMQLQMLQTWEKQRESWQHKHPINTTKFQLKTYNRFVAAFETADDLVMFKLKWL